MKINAFKIAVLVILILTFVGSMTSCKNSINREEAEAMLVSFYGAVEAEDYETAASLFHKDQPTDPELLMEYLEDIEAEKSVDFSDGITIYRYTGTGGAAYDLARGGAYYEMDMTLLVGDASTSLEVTIEFIKNKNGFGMYNIHI